MCCFIATFIFFYITIHFPKGTPISVFDWVNIIVLHIFVPMFMMFLCFNLALWNRSAISLSVSYAWILNLKTGTRLYALPLISSSYLPRACYDRVIKQTVTLLLVNVKVYIKQLWILKNTRQFQARSCASCLPMMMMMINKIYRFSQAELFGYFLERCCKWI